MKKKLFSILLVTCLSTFIHAQNALTGRATVTIDVRHLEEKDGIFTLSGNQIFDSAYIKNNQLIFKKNIKEPLVVGLRYYPKSASYTDYKTTPALPKNTFFFCITPGNTLIIANDSLQTSQIAKPNKYQKEYTYFVTELTKYEAENIDPLWKQFQMYMKNGPSDSAYPAQRRAQMASEIEWERLYKPFIEKNASTTPVSLLVLSKYFNEAGAHVNMNNIISLFDRLNKEYQNLPSALKIKEKIDLFTSLSVGKKAPNFTQNDTLRQPVSLNDFKGKYVLIDFWASWCGPCRAENPHVVAAFKKFKDKNFTILGVSFDQNKESWLNAIHKDGLTWTHVSDLQYWKNAVGKLFDIHFIPQNVIIDPNGTIIAKNIGGQQLETVLEEKIK